jgi:hypothetical protein
MDDEPILITYTNYRGETADRLILPRVREYGSTEYHPEKQWLITAFDVEKDAMRTFAEKDISKGLKQVLDRIEANERL